MYTPGKSLIGEPTPQTDPALFTDAEIKAEIMYLAKLDRKYGAHDLRLLARAKLWKVLAERQQEGK